MDVKLGAAINIDLTLEQTMGRCQGQLVFSMPAADNPFAAKDQVELRNPQRQSATGLAEMKSGEGTLIAFATGPGQTALDGGKALTARSTRALLANLTSPASRSSRR